tara:strand:- start:441 stop:959 length:519 start_codon:yes stop_codon:yes gene_type:complete
MRKSLILLSALSLLPLASCGFEPIYAKKQGVPSGETAYLQSALNKVSIANIPDQEGVILRNELIDRFYVAGRPETAFYKLDVLPIREIRRELDITVGAEATRAQLEIIVPFVLTDILTGEVLLRARAETFASFNIIADEYATRVSERRTRENALRDIARQIEQKTAFTLDRL